MFDDHTICDLKDWITQSTLLDCTYIKLINVLNKNIVLTINPMVCYRKFINRWQLPGMTVTIALYQFVCGLRKQIYKPNYFQNRSQL
ncbi:hypothetical protein PR048_025136 [Dryococelus australis]|uniref:Uncharacterized protein n=1 Tax=Dryococelus australis TaxID=614101 RepID=A0ABQ9GQJ7_9NEOP|nr:hypothetical protein PR048_025136 [Dryococelus australis]